MHCYCCSHTAAHTHACHSPCLLLGSSVHRPHSAYTIIPTSSQTDPRSTFAVPYGSTLNEPTHATNPSPLQVPKGEWLLQTAAGSVLGRQTIQVGGVGPSFKGPGWCLPCDASAASHCLKAWGQERGVVRQVCFRCMCRFSCVLGGPTTKMNTSMCLHQPALILLHGGKDPQHRCPIPAHAEPPVFSARC